MLSDQKGGKEGLGEKLILHTEQEKPVLGFEVDKPFCPKGFLISDWKLCGNERELIHMGL